MTEKILYTKYSVKLNDLVKEILESKTVKYQMESHATGYIVYYEFGSNIFVSDASLDLKEFPTKGAVEVANTEFIKFLEELPERTSFNLGDYEAKIEKGSICIGCHEFTEREFERIAKEVARVRGETTLKFKDRRDVVIGPKGIEAEGAHFSFEDFDKVQEAIEKANKK